MVTIRLGQFLKLAGIAATGGEAKYLIQEGMIQVNGEVETRRKKQLHAGDRVTIEDQTFIVEMEPDPDGQENV